MKAGWEVKTLGDLFDIGSSKRVMKSDWTDNGIPFFRAREIVKLAQNGFVDNDLFISESHYDELISKYGGPMAGDLMVSAVGTLGKCYEVNAQDRFYYKDASVICLRPKTKINSKFIRYAFKTHGVLDQVTAGKGATVGTFTIQRAKKTILPLPPLEEQKRIVSILDEAFKSLDRARENAEANLNSARELFEERRRTLVSNKTTGEPLTLKDVCINFEYGTSSKSSATGCTPVLRMGNLQDGEIDWTNLVYTNDAGEREKYMLHEGDVLFNRTNSQAHVGKTSIFDGKRPAIFAGYLIRVTPKKEKLTNEFLNHYLNSDVAREYGRSVMGKSVNQANISGSKLKTYPINLPKLERQHEIALELDTLKVKVQEMQALYRSKLQDISDLRQSLLQKAFAGELT